MAPTFSSTDSYFVEAAFMEAAKDVERKFVAVYPRDVLDSHLRDYPIGMPTPSSSTIREHINYRIVLDVVGEPLSAFKSTWELNKVMLNAVEAHHGAVVKADVLHRDVSVGHIVIARMRGPPVGRLIDWELSKYDEREGRRVSEKTGTHQFVAARLVSDESVARRTVGDDLESFMLVYLWIAMLYAPNDMSSSTRGRALELFDSRNSYIKEFLISIGPATPYNYHLRSTFLRATLFELMNTFRFRYSVPLMESPAEDLEHEQNRQKLETHEFMIQILEEGWKNEEWKAIADCAEERTWSSQRW